MVAKGLALAWAAGLVVAAVEKGFGFWVEGVEKGFVAALVLGVGFVPKRSLPMFRRVGSVAGSSRSVKSLPFSLGLAFSSSALTRTPRNPRTLPCFRWHVLRRQVKMYSRLSCPGKCSGKSPFSCSSKLMRSLQTLHFANSRGGGVV